MKASEVRHLVHKEITQAYLAGVIPNAPEWDLETITPPFEFDQPVEDNDCTYKLSNKELQKTYRIHHEIHDGTHRAWWYNFDDWFETESGEEMVKHLVLWLCRLIKNHEVQDG